MAGESVDSTARIVRILVDCGMIAPEELEIVRALIRGSNVEGDVLPQGFREAGRGAPRAKGFGHSLG